MQSRTSWQGSRVGGSVKQLMGLAVAGLLMCLLPRTGHAEAQSYDPLDDQKEIIEEAVQPADAQPKGTVTVLSEGFEGSFPGSWSVGDANSSGTPAYWDDVDSAFGGEGTHSGSWKGYCADIGNAGTTTSPLYQNNS